MEPIGSISQGRMDTFASIGARLRLAREALGKSQSELAEHIAAAGVAGATRQSQSLYEKGKRMPDAAYLAVLAGIGIDVLYVLTGEHSKPVAPTFDGRTDALKEVVAILERLGLEGPQLMEILYILRVSSAPRVLSPEQTGLLNSYDKCSPDDQAAIRRLADAAAQTASSMGPAPGSKYRPKSAGSGQPSVHEPTTTYSKKAKKPQEAA